MDALIDQPILNINSLKKKRAKDIFAMKNIPSAKKGSPNGKIPISTLFVTQMCCNQHCKLMHST